MTVGIAIGLLLALGCTHLISNMLYGVRSIDPSTIGLATVLMAGVAALAGFIPARRASNMEPTAALRYE